MRRNRPQSDREARLKQPRCAEWALLCRQRPPTGRGTEVPCQRPATLGCLLSVVRGPRWGRINGTTSPYRFSGRRDGFARAHERYVCRASRSLYLAWIARHSRRYALLLVSANALDGRSTQLLPVRGEPAGWFASSSVGFVRRPQSWHFVGWSRSICLRREKRW